MGMDHYLLAGQVEMEEIELASVEGKCSIERFHATSFNVIIRLEVWEANVGWVTNLQPIQDYTRYKSVKTSDLSLSLSLTFRRPISL